MARDQIDMTPLQSRDELVAWLEAGVKAPSDFRIGTEHEKTPFTLAGHRPVPYEGARGIGALLEGMKLLLGWEPIMERGNIIGLYDVTGGGAISLEPGGQFELSGAQVETVHQTSSELMAHLAKGREVAAPLRIAGMQIEVSTSIGIALFPEHGPDARALVRSADTAMYTAKRSGAGPTVYDSSQYRSPLDKLTIFTDLRANRRIVFATEPSGIESAWRDLILETGVGPSGHDMSCGRRANGSDDGFLTLETASPPGSCRPPSSPPGA